MGDSFATSDMAAFYYFSKLQGLWHRFCFVFVWSLDFTSAGYLAGVGWPAPPLLSCYLQVGWWWLENAGNSLAHSAVQRRWEKQLKSESRGKEIVKSPLMWMYLQCKQWRGRALGLHAMERRQSVFTDAWSDQDTAEYERERTKSARSS